MITIRILNLEYSDRVAYSTPGLCNDNLKQIRMKILFKIVPKQMFFTKGVGHHRNKLQSFELALRDAGIEKCNLVTISSIFPPDCKIISKTEGLKLLAPGQILFVVMARENTDEPSRLVTAAVGLAQPKDKKQYLSLIHI